MVIAGELAQSAYLDVSGAGQAVHVADLADFFARVLEDDSAYGRFVVGDGAQKSVG